MKIQTANLCSREQRSRELVEGVNTRKDALVSNGRRQGFDSKGRYSIGLDDQSEHLLARFSASFFSEVQIDPKTNEVQHFQEQSKGGRRSWLYGDVSDLSRQTMQRTGAETVYTETVREFSPEKCQSYTERVKVSGDGQMQYTRTDHLDGKMERFFRANPSVRMLSAQALGGALGGAVGSLVAAHTGLPINLGAAAGASVAAFVSGGLASEKPRWRSTDGLLENCAYLPAQGIHFASGMGAVGVALACLVAFSGR